MINEREQMEQAITRYAIQHEISESEALGFLARRSEIEIIFDLLGLSATETTTRTVTSHEKELLVGVFLQRGFRLSALHIAM